MNAANVVGTCSTLLILRMTNLSFNWGSNYHEHSWGWRWLLSAAGAMHYENIIEYGNHMDIFPVLVANNLHFTWARHLPSHNSKANTFVSRKKGGKFLLFFFWEHFLGRSSLVAVHLTTEHNIEEHYSLWAARLTRVIWSLGIEEE